MRRAATAADRGQLRTAARLPNMSKLLSATEISAAGIALLHQTDASGQARRGCAFQRHADTLRCDARPQHAISHIRDAARHARPAPIGERGSHLAVLLTSPRGLRLLNQLGMLWSDRRLASAFSEPWILAKVIGGDKGGGKARPVAMEEMLLQVATPLTLRAHHAGKKCRWTFSSTESTARAPGQKLRG